MPLRVFQVGVESAAILLVLFCLASCLVSDEVSADEVYGTL